MAANVRPTAKPLPFNVWTNSGLEAASRLNLIFARRAWKSVQLEQELISL